MRVMGKYAIFVLLAFAIQLSMSLGCRAQEVPTVKVEFTPEHTYLVLQVGGSTSLATVLQEFCKTTDAACDGLSFAANITVWPVEIQGSWSEVLSKLMEGSHLNFATIAPHDARGGRLLIQGFALPLGKSDSGISPRAALAGNDTSHGQLPRADEASVARAESELPTTTDSFREPVSGESADAPA